VTQPEADKEMEAIRYIIHQRLRSCPEVETVPIGFEAHLDEDAISAFVDGRIGENESASIVSHLVACGSCRDATARLIRLESFSIADDEVTTPEESPSRLRQFLADLATQVVPSSGEDAVFAYQNPDTDQNAEDPAKQKQNDSRTESEKPKNS
jgi:hypothetical protein